MHAQKHRIAAVVFDLEGTLVRHIPRQAKIVEESFRSAGRPLRFKVRNLYHIRSLPTFHDKSSFFRALLALHKSKLKPSQMRAAKPSIVQRELSKATSQLTSKDETLVKAAVDFYSECRKRPNLFADLQTPIKGAAELLAFLHKKRVKTALVANANELQTMSLCKRFNFTFDAVISGEQVEREKPAPDGLLLALNRLSVEPQKAMAVDDSIAGIEAAKGAGFKSVVGVLSGSTTSSLFRQSKIKPDVIVKDVSVIKERYFE